MGLKTQKEQNYNDVKYIARGGRLFFFLFSMHSNNHNFRNNDRVELILVPHDVELNNGRV